jgi:uncharacterized protein (DUF1697 family)
MKTWVILLRGVMPAGRNKVPMAPLRVVLEAAGLKDVQSYIQSGNVVARSRLGQGKIEKLVHDAIAQAFGGDIAVVARTAEQYRAILESCPFKHAETAKRYYTILASEPDTSKASEFRKAVYAPDDIRLIGDVIYTLCATKYSDLKINNNVIERRLGVAGTTRNYNTTAKLVALCA